MTEKTVTLANGGGLPDAGASGGGPPRGESLLSSSAKEGDVRRDWATPAPSVVFLLLFFCLAQLFGCDAPRTGEAVPPASLRLADLNPVLTPGDTAVLPAVLAATSGAAALPPPQLTIRLDEAELSARVYWAWTQTPAAAARTTWLAAPRRWRLTLDPPAGGAFATPVVVFDVPPTSRADWLQVGDSRVRPIWLDEDGSLWRQDLKDPLNAPLHLFDAVLPEAEDPARCWRAALMADRLHRLDVRPRFADPLVQALARQQVRRWQASLDRLAAADIDLAREVRRRLTLVLSDDGALVPAWPTDEQQLADLLHTLLSPAHDADARAAQARAWLAAQPHVRAWAETTGRPDRVGVGLANLTNQPRAVRLRWRGTYEAPRTIELPPESMRRLVLTPPLDLPPGELTRVLRVEAGEQVQELAYAARPAVARPPGLLLGPLFQPRTLRIWRQAGLRPQPAEHDTRAQLRRTVAGWELLIECRVPSDIVQPAGGVKAAATAVGPATPTGRALHDPAHLRASDLIGEAVYLFVGPVDEPSAILAFTPSGEVEAFRGRLPADAFSAERHSDAASWSVTVRLPERWIDGDGLLALGLLRSFGGSEIPALPTSWPEPIFPWRLDPGRLLIDLSQWDDLNGARPL